jgi:hypothetical protein
MVMWELCSAGDRFARCVYQHDPPGDHVVTVAVGEIQSFHEALTTESAACDEAEHLLAHFIRNGWTTVMYRDSRIAIP